MKSTILLAVTGAVLAMASPIQNRIDERALKTKWVTDVVTVVVTAGDKATAAVFKEAPAPKITSVQVEKQAPPPPPAPTTVPAPPPPPPVVVPKPKPEPKTTVVVKPAAPPPPPPAPKPQPVVSQPDSNDYEGTILEQHNVHRRNHSSPDLSWDSTLASYAFNSASKCVFAHDMTQGGGGYGQNLASWGSTGDISDLKVKTAAQGVTMQWYNDEMMNWSFYGSDNPPPGANLEGWGHFTQVVWKSSTSVGCATVQCPAGTVLSYPSWYTVCNYDPPGNYGGEYGSNVLEPKGMAYTSV